MHYRNTMTCSLQRKRDRELKASNDTLEDEFSKDTDVPLTDVVRAARATVSKPAMEEDAAYAAAYKEEERAA